MSGVLIRKGNLDTERGVRTQQANKRDLKTHTLLTPGMSVLQNGESMSFCVPPSLQSFVMEALGD